MFSCCGEEQNLNTDVRGKILHRMRAKTQESEGGREMGRIQDSTVVWRPLDAYAEVRT
jgi:hypothetical protein